MSANQHVVRQHVCDVCEFPRVSDSLPPSMLIKCACVCVPAAKRKRVCATLRSGI